MKHAILIFLMAAGVILVASTPASAQWQRKCITRPSTYDSLDSRTKSSSGYYDVTCEGNYPAPVVVEVFLWAAAVDTFVIKAKRVWKGVKNIDSSIVKVPAITPDITGSWVTTDTSCMVILRLNPGEGKYYARAIIPHVFRDFSINRVSGNKTNAWYYDLLINDN